MRIESIPNLNEPILFGPRSLQISHRWWKWLQNRTAPPVWQAPVLGASIAYFGAPYNVPGYSIDGFGRVFIRGLLVGAGLTVGSTIFTLPVGFRPVNQSVFTGAGASTSGSGVWRIDVLAGGQVQVSSALSAAGNPVNYLSLDSISFLTY